MKALRRWLLASVTVGVAAGLVQAAESPRVPATVQWDGVPRVVAFGDVHGAFDELQQLLRTTGLIDAGGRWAAGSTHVVSLGDLIDRGPGSRQVMDLLMRLQQEARAAGGQMHVLLGNHEVMGLLGDLRYVTREEFASFADLEVASEREAARLAWRNGSCPAPCAEFDQRFPPGYFGFRAGFAPGGRYGGWLLSLPVAIRINDTLYMHGGPGSAVQGMNLAELNLRYRTVLADYLGLETRLSQARLILPEDEYELRARRARERLAANADAQVDGALSQAVQRFERVSTDPLLSEEGPNWFRGAALCQELTQVDELNLLLKQFGAAKVVVGHTPTRDLRVASRFDGRVIKLDTGMNRAAYRGNASALILEGATQHVRYTDRPDPASVTPEGLFVAPGQVEDGEVREALSRGELSVTGTRGDEVDIAVRHNGQVIPAVFQALGRDAARREVAAFQLDRLLGMGIVPATVEREVQGRAGVLQARPRRWVTQAGMRPGAISNGWCRAEPQFQLMYALDTLTGNEQRTPGSILYDADNGMVFVSSFARAFGTGRALPAWLRAQPPKPGAELRARLARLDAAALENATGAMLDRNARQAILSRRDTLLALPEARQQ